MLIILEKFLKWRYYHVETKEGVAVIRAVATTTLHFASKEHPLTNNIISNVIDILLSWLRHGQIKDLEQYIESLIAEGTFNNHLKFHGLLDDVRPFPRELKIILLSCGIRAMYWTRMELGVYPLYSPELLQYIGVIARHINLNRRDLNTLKKRMRELEEEAEAMRVIYPYYHKNDGGTA